jgi:hypothetical protein
VASSFHDASKAWWHLEEDQLVFLLIPCSLHPAELTESFEDPQLGISVADHLGVTTLIDILIVSTGINF